MKQLCFPYEVRGASTPTEFKDRSLSHIDPKREQFEPTEAVPIRQHHRMAGGG